MTQTYKTQKHIEAQTIPNQRLIIWVYQMKLNTSKRYWKRENSILIVNLMTRRLARPIDQIPDKVNQVSESSRFNWTKCDRPKHNHKTKTCRILRGKPDSVKIINSMPHLHQNFKKINKDFHPNKSRMKQIKELAS